MSTLSTTNYALHKWVSTDTVRMSEFNENWDAIDTKLKALDVLTVSQGTDISSLETSKADQSDLDATNTTVALKRDKTDNGFDGTLHQIAIKESGVEKWYVESVSGALNFKLVGTATAMLSFTNAGDATFYKDLSISKDNAALWFKTASGAKSGKIVNTATGSTVTSMDFFPDSSVAAAAKLTPSGALTVASVSALIGFSAFAGFNLRNAAFSGGDVSIYLNANDASDNFGWVVKIPAPKGETANSVLAVGGKGRNISFAPTEGGSSYDIIHAGRSRVFVKGAIGGATTLTGTVGLIKFSSILTDTQAEYSASTGLFTAKETGLYEVNAMLYATGVNANANVLGYVYKNGVEEGILGLANASAAASTVAMTSSGYLVQLAVGDTLSIYARVSASTSGAWNSVSHLNIKKVG